MSAPTRLCVPIVSTDPPLAVQVCAARDAGADLVELRVDLIGDIAAVEALLASPLPIPAIVTIRAASEGGHWDGDDDARIALLERLGLRLPGYVDLELAAWMRSANLRQKVCLVARPRDASGEPAVDRSKNALILSHHDTRGTPPNLDAVFEALDSSPATVAKAVFTAADASDALRVLVELERRGKRRDWIALAMGDAGLVTRVLARKFGAFLTFATLEAGAESAPGQVTIGTLRGLYRWDALRPATRVFGVVGWPVAHSLSPHLHNAAMHADAVDGVYVPLPVQPSEAAFMRFMDLVAANSQLDISGLSVTIPHKEHALRWLEARGKGGSPCFGMASGGYVDNEARRCGAVNTLTRDADGAWHGTNTDVIGVRDALDDAAVFDDPRRSVRRALVLGAGGAARAVLTALSGRGVGVTVSSRRHEAAAALARDFGADAAAWDERERVAADLVVNCTPIGMWPAADASPMPAQALRPDQVVFDTVYRPACTQLLADARAAGCRTVAGTEMFIRQAAAQYQTWHGRPAPLSVLREVLESVRS
ncbi:MAG: type I 3-dehydroquinate dehydratase [Phycisphaerales bacterium]|nr:type I 3-dehydroquinate dehydratase [Phycisphaerales bacterium]